MKQNKCELTTSSCMNNTSRYVGNLDRSTKATKADLCLVFEYFFRTEYDLVENSPGESNKNLFRSMETDFKKLQEERKLREGLTHTSSSMERPTEKKK